MPRLERLVAPALLLLASSCAEDKRAAELACQQRLADAPANLDMGNAVSRESVVANSFELLSRRYAEMPLEGCTEGQAYTARSLSRLARELGETAGATQRSLEGEPDLKNREVYMKFAADLEQFENRRRVLREELAEMKAGKR